MEISVSNIAWKQEHDEHMYAWLNRNKIERIEIAPTRILGENPYSKLHDAADYKNKLFQKYNLEISSMQSIWYGRQEKMFKEGKQRKALEEYTKKAIEFANVIGCKNLVFGCPKNRNMYSQNDLKIAIEFFCTVGEYAQKNNTVLALEANPAIYNTNFMNSTSEAIDIAQIVNMEGIRVNYDLGTVIENSETIDEIETEIKWINHIHISEPNLVPVNIRRIHTDLITLLKKCNYKNCISLEMSCSDNIAMIENIMLGLIHLMRERKDAI